MAKLMIVIVVLLASVCGSLTAAEVGNVPERQSHHHHHHHRRHKHHSTVPVPSKRSIPHSKHNRLNSLELEQQSTSLPQEFPSFASTSSPPSSFSTVAPSVVFPSPPAASPPSDSTVNQIPLDDAISSNFAQIQGELPADRQVSIVLSSAQTKRFYFQTMEPQRSFSLTITPCETLLRYQLLFINSNSIKNLRKRKVRRRSKKYYVKLLRRRLQQHATKMLVNQTVSERFSYQEENILEHGLYILQITAQESHNTSVQIYLSSASIKSPYPRLPPVASVLTKQIKSANNSAVEVWWNPVIPLKNEPSFVYEYCIAINEYLKPRSQCLSHEQVMRNQSTNMITSFHESEFWLKESENEVRSFLETSSLANSEKYFKCGKENSIQIHDLQPEMLYRVAVFVRNQVNGFVSRYWTSNFTLAKPKVDPSVSPATVLHDSLFTGVFLEHKQRFSKKFTYKLPSNELSDRLYLFVQPCDGIGPVQIVVRKLESLEKKRSEVIHDYEYDDFEDAPNDDVLLTEEISETKTFEIKIPRERYSYEIELNTEDIKQSRSLVLLLSSDLSRFPFPRMPTNQAIRPLFSMRKCNSVTLAWDASPDDNVMYCVYQRDAEFRFSSFEESKELCNRIRPALTKPITVKRALNDSNREENSLEIDAEEEEKQYTPTREVACKRYKSSKRRQDNMIIQNIRSLHPGKRYVFQIVIRKKRGRELAYEQIWAETKPRIAM